MGSHHQVLQDRREPASALRHAVPDAGDAFLEVRAAEGGGAG